MQAIYQIALNRGSYRWSKLALHLPAYVLRWYNIYTLTNVFPGGSLDIIP